MCITFGITKRTKKKRKTHRNKQDRNNNYVRTRLISVRAGDGSVLHLHYHNNKGVVRKNKKNKNISSVHANIKLIVRASAREQVNEREKSLTK